MGGARRSARSARARTPLLYTTEIIVETDHKPLEVILKKPVLAAPKRLQRMMMMQLQNTT